MYERKNSEVPLQYNQEYANPQEISALRPYNQEYANPQEISAPRNQLNYQNLPEGTRFTSINQNASRSGPPIVNSIRGRPAQNASPLRETVQTTSLLREPVQTTSTMGQPQRMRLSESQGYERN